MSIVTIPLAGQIGLVKDIPAQELALNGWSHASNMVFRDGSAERVFGESPVFSNASVTPYFLQPMQTRLYKYWLHAGLNAVYVDDGVTRTNITPSVAPAGVIDSKYTGGVLNGVAVLNNGSDVPWYWLGNVASPMQTLTGWNSAWRCNAIRPLRNYLVALNISKSGAGFPNLVKWSAAAVPGAVPTSWDEADASKDAGEQDLPGDDPIVDMVPLGDTGIIYKERSMWVMRYIGAPFVWQFQRLPGNVGALSQNCVADTPVGHVVLTQGDVVLHNGQGPTSIINAKLRKYLFSAMDSTLYKRSFVSINPPKNEVWVCFPEIGKSSCTKALVWNWIDNVWGIRDLANVTCAAAGVGSYGAVNSWTSNSNAWTTNQAPWSVENIGAAQSRMVLGTTSNTLLGVDNVATFNGSNVLASLERTGISFDDPTSVKTIKLIRPRIDGTSGNTIKIEFGSQMDVEGGITWSSSVNYVIGSSFEAHGFATGRFLAVRFSSTGGQPWRIRSFDAEIEKNGYY